MNYTKFIFSALCIFYLISIKTYGQNCLGTQRVDASYELEINDVCEGIEILVRNTSQEFGNTNTFYIWDWGDGTKDTTQELTDVRHTYLFSETDACDEGIKVGELRLDARVPGCTQFNHFVIKPVYIYLKPIAKFETEPVLCAPNITATFENQSCATDTGTVYSWDFGDPASGAANTSDEFEPKHTFSGPGFYNVTLRVQSLCGSGVSSQVVEVKAPPIANASLNIISGSICVPVIAQLNNQSSNYDTYRWTVTPSDGAAYIDSTNNLSLNPRLQFTKAGTYTIKLDVTNQCSTVTWQSTLVVSDAPTVNWADQNPACEKFVYTPQITYAGSINAYSWTFEGGIPATSNLANPTNIEFNTPGIHNITLTVNGACGNQTFTKTVEVIRKETITFTPVAPLCNTSDPVQLSVNVAGGTWSGSGVNSQGLFNPATANIGTNTIQYRYGPDNCRSEGSLDILVRAGTPLNLGSDLSICNDQSDITLPFSPSGGVWRGNGIVDSLQGIFSPARAGVGEQTLTYIFTETTNGCVTRAQKRIRVEPVPSINFAENSLPFCNSSENVSLPNTVTLQVNPSGGNGSWTGTGIIDTAQGIFNGNTLAVGNYSILYTYTSPAGCIAKDSFVIQIIPKQQAVAQADTTVCISIGSLNLQATSAGGQWSDSRNSINPATGMIDLARAGGGTLTYTYTIFPNSTCESRDEVQVEVIDLSGVNAGRDVAFCESEGQINLSGFSPAGGRWRGAGIVDDAQGIVNIASLAPGDYTLTYQIESQAVASCAAEDQLILTVNPLPELGFNTSGKQCIGETIGFTNTTTNGSSYQWDFGNGQTSTQENPEVTYSTAGDYNLSLNVKSAFGCEADTSTTIHVSEPPPTVAFDLDQRSGCADLLVTFINRSRGEDVDFIWNFGNGRIDSISSPLPVTFLGGLEDTTYFVRLSAKNTCGENLFIDSIRVLSRPVANFGTQLGRYCSGEAVEIRNASIGRPTSYFWDFGNGLTSRDSIPETQYYFTNNLPDTFQITLTASNNCATDTASQLVFISPANVAAFFNLDANEFCVGDTIRVRNLATPTASVTYEFGDSTSSATANPLHVYRAPGSYKLIQYARGCGFDSTFVFVTVKPLPSLQIKLDEYACFQSDISFDYNASDIIGTFWDFGDGNTAQLTNPTHRYDSTGIYTVQLTVTAANGCRAATRQNIEILPLPSFDLLTPDSLCVGERAAFEVIPYGNLSSYNWQFGDKEQVSGKLVEHSYAQQGIYNATATVTDAFGCVNSDSRPVFVRPTPQAAFLFTALNNCTPTDITFANQSKTANSYRWNFGDGNTTALTNPTHTFYEGGEFSAQLIASYDDICFDTTTQYITINPIPNVDLQVEDLTCHGKNDGRIRVLNSRNYSITVSGEDYLQQGNNLFEALHPGTYDVEVVAPTGCDTVYTVEIKEPDSLIAYIFPDTIRMIVGDTATIEIIANNTNLDYQWLPESDLIKQDSSIFLATPQRSIWYELIASDSTCQVRDLVFVEVDVERHVYIPNAFSPNGDNVNEYFYIHGGDGIDTIQKFLIFERRGSLLYQRENIEPNDPTVGWDGTYKGKKMNPAVFVYYAEIKFTDGRVEQFKGDITLVR